MKEMELRKAQEESEKAKQMVEAKQCTPPKKSKLLKNLEMQKNIVEQPEFREPITKHSRKMQRIESFDS